MTTSEVEPPPAPFLLPHPRREKQAITSRWFEFYLFKEGSLRNTELQYSSFF